MLDGTVESAAVVAPFAGVAVAAEVDAHQPAAASSSHNCPVLRARETSSGKVWYTAGTLTVESVSFNSMTWEEGGVRENQSAPR
jgi:hypothetical protein